jgi:hypothetical protein
LRLITENNTSKKAAGSRFKPLPYKEWRNHLQKDHDFIKNPVMQKNQIISTATILQNGFEKTQLTRFCLYHLAGMV